MRLSIVFGILHVAVFFGRLAGMAAEVAAKVGGGLEMVAVGYLFYGHLGGCEQGFYLHDNLSVN